MTIPNEKAAIDGGIPAVSRPLPHFSWPPPLPELPDVLAEYVRSGKPLSIVDRSGVLAELEDHMATLHKRKYAIVTSSGTMALYSAFFACGVCEGTEVISTVYSFHATATPLLHLGAKIVFCDIEPDTGNIDVLELERRISPDTRLIVTNHMWGHPVDCDAIAGICRKRNIYWVEDCSHAHFSKCRGRTVGTFGDVSVMSLQGNKLLTGGEGGILLTDSQEIYERATLLGHSLARSEKCVTLPQYADIRHTGYGLKFRMHPLAAIMALHLLRHHALSWIDMRNATLDYFSQGLLSTGWVMPMARRGYVDSMGAHYGFKPLIDFKKYGLERTDVVKALQAEGLDVSIPKSQPFHQLPLFDPDRFPIGRFVKHANPASFPGADAYYESIISLPTFTFHEDRLLIDAYVDGFQKVGRHFGVIS